jgi:hypothetical protein
MDLETGSVCPSSRLDDVSESTPTANEHVVMRLEPMQGKGERPKPELPQLAEDRLVILPSRDDVAIRRQYRLPEHDIRVQDLRELRVSGRFIVGNQPPPLAAELPQFAQ